MTTLNTNHLVNILRELQPGMKPKQLSGGLKLRRYELHGMSEVVMWREDNIAPSDEELKILEESIRVLCAPDFLARTIDHERSGESFAYRFFWPQKKGRIHILPIQMRMALGV